MKKVFATFCVLAILLGVVLYGRSQLDGLGIEYYADGRVGVADLVQLEYDQQDLSFLCSAVFTLGQDGAGGRAVRDITAQFIQRHKAPNDLTFAPLGDVETICQEAGKRYLLRQDFQLSRSGIPLEQIQVAARFSYSPEKETFTVQNARLSAGPSGCCSFPF